MALVYIAVPARPLPAKTEHANATGIFASFSAPIILIGLAAGLIIACEVTALLWSSELLAATAPELAAISGLGAAFFGFCNAMLRLPGDSLRARFGDIPLMTGTLCIAIAGFIGLGMTSSFAANVFFFALTGMGLSVLCPCLFAMASRQTPHNRAAGLSAAMLVAGVPRIIAPSLFGWIAELFSTRFAFGLCALVAMAALATIHILNRLPKR
jgi:MFS family permease